MTRGEQVALDAVPAAAENACARPASSSTRSPPPRLRWRRASAPRKVLLFGNGGSAADAQHLAAEFVGRFLAKRPAHPASR